MLDIGWWKTLEENLYYFILINNIALVWNSTSNTESKINTISSALLLLMAKVGKMELLME